METHYPLPVDLLNRGRKMVPLTFGLLALFVISQPTNTGPSTDRSELHHRNWTIESVTRTALVAEPIEKRREVHPLVLVFHGHGGTSRNAARPFALHTHWPEAFVVDPQGLPTPGKFDPEGNRSSWQKRPADAQNRDLAFFDRMLADLFSEGWVNPRQVFVMGHSNGARFTYVMWAARGPKLRAVAPSASAAEGLLRQLQPLSCLHLAGKEDTVVPFIDQKRTMDALSAALNGQVAKVKESLPSGWSA